MWSDQAAASVTDTGDSFLDCWFYYAREREDIFRHIVTHQIHGKFDIWIALKVNASHLTWISASASSSRRGAAIR